MLLRNLAVWTTCALIALGLLVVSPKQVELRPSNPAGNRAYLANTELPTVLSAGQNRKLVQAYGQLPLGFEANRGQTDPHVDFLARGTGYEFFLTGTEAVMVVGGPGAPGRRGGPAVAPSAPSVLRMKLLSSNPGPRVTGRDQLAGTVNYFIGKDSAKWHSGIPRFARVEYKNVYPGVDLVY